MLLHKNTITFFKAMKAKLNNQETIFFGFNGLAENLGEFAKITVNGYILGSNSEISNV